MTTAMTNEKLCALLQTPYKFFVTYDDEEYASLPERIAAYAEGEKSALLSCEVRAIGFASGCSAEKLKVSFEITSVQANTYFGAKLESVGNCVDAFPYWNLITEEGDLGDCKVALNDGGVSACGGGYRTLCVPLAVWNAYKNYTKPDTILQGAERLAKYLADMYDIEVLPAKIAEFFE